MVKDYQGKREYLVLSMIKKYPLYSIDKLHGEMPNISRHSIQRILEKHNLSRVEQRLDFAKENRGRFLPVFKKIKTEVLDFLKEFSFERVKNFLEEKPKLNWQLVRNLVIFLVLILTFWQGISFVLAKPPDITLEQPPAGFTNQGEKLFVIGKVVPPRSRVTVNGNKVFLNGDGSFTAAVNIPLGESALEIEAVYKKKEAKVLRLVKRIPTQEELQTQEEEEARKKLETVDKMAELDRRVKDLVAAKSAMGAEGGKKGFLRIINNQVKEEGSFASIVGEVANLGEEPASWVMITAKFFNETGNMVDSKYGFATDFGKVIKPKERAEFETQATTLKFDYYSLELSWEEEAVAGEATESGKIEE